MAPSATGAERAQIGVPGDDFPPPPQRPVQDRLVFYRCLKAPEYKGGGKREIPEKTRRPVASSGTISTCEYPGANPPGIKPVSLRSEASCLTTTRPRSHTFSGIDAIARVKWVPRRSLASGRSTFCFSRLRPGYCFPLGAPSVYSTEQTPTYLATLTPHATGHRGGVGVRLLASHQCELGSIPCQITPGFSQAVIVLDDAAGWQVYSGIPRFPTHLHSGSAPYSSLFTLIGSSWSFASKVKKRVSNTGDTNTHFYCLIAPTRKACSVSVVALPTSVQSMSRQSQCSRVLQAPSRTVGFTRLFHTLSTIQATNTSLAVVLQSPVVHNRLRSRTLARRPPSKTAGRWVAAFLRPPPRIFPNTRDASRRAEASASLTRTFLHIGQTCRNLQQGRRALTHARRRAARQPDHLPAQYSRVSQKVW
ncbi:hypothetical protein PR048_033576 [Dryococelus australis]|uniref:Uncharacterized protein n=1 Tax=Dryococelus australis TaxID=614101 RepID=A0ABQ9G3Q9_9NEOP|nr:hypothetical protein PR048_033576 [Dryococelus australis]